MAWRFQKRIKIAPGLRLNISKSAISLTGGVKGASVNAGKNGSYLNLGVPGSGFSTRTRLGGKTKRKAKAATDTPDAEAQDEPGLGTYVVILSIFAGLVWGVWSLLT